MVLGWLQLSSAVARRGGERINASRLLRASPVSRPGHSRHRAFSAEIRMAKPRDADDGELSVQRDVDGMDGTEDGGDGLSLEEILKLYNQPINEEQAWAVCYQCSRTMAKGHRRRNSSAAAGPASVADRRIEGPGDVRIKKDGSVRVQYQGCAGKTIMSYCLFLLLLRSRPGLHLNITFFRLNL